MPEPSPTVKAIVASELANTKNREALVDVLQELDDHRQADRDRAREQKRIKKRDKKIDKAVNHIFSFGSRYFYNCAHYAGHDQLLRRKKFPFYFFYTSTAMIL